MTEQEIKKLYQDKWPTKYPHGKQALLSAIKKAAKAKIFDIEEEDELIALRNANQR